MAKFELKLPKMGESVAEATITSWLKEVGDTIEMDEPVLEVATDKVDSEVPSEVDGVIAEILFDVDDVISVGQTIAIIETDANVDIAAPSIKADSVVAETIEQNISEIKNNITPVQDFSSSDNFYSPLVKNIAKEEGISLAQLETTEGTGTDGRETKNDMLSYVKNR